MVNEIINNEQNLDKKKIYQNVMAFFTRSKKNKSEYEKIVEIFRSRKKRKFTEI